MEKNIFVSQVNLTTGGIDLFINDCIALGEHLKKLDNKWDYSVGQLYSYGAYMEIAYDNKICISSYVDKETGTSGLWYKRVIPSYAYTFTVLAAPAQLPSRPRTYTLVTLLPAPDAKANLYQNYTSVLNFKAPRATSVEGARSSYLSYGMGLSSYGAVLTIPIVDSLNELPASSIDCYFFEMQSVIDPEKKTWAILCNMAEGPIAETKNDFPTEMFLLSGEHIQLEKLPPEYFTSMAHTGVVPVLTNMCSKQIKYYAPHLYIKETTHNDCFGHIKIEDKYFLAGAGFALETDEHN